VEYESGLLAGDPGIADDFGSLFGKVGKKAWILPLMLAVVNVWCAGEGRLVGDEEEGESDGEIGAW